MKTIKPFFYTILFLAVVSFTACSKDDDGGDGGGAAEGTIKAKVDGSNFTTIAMTTSGQLVSAGGVVSFTMLGSNSDGKSMAFTIIGFDNEGTYDIGGGANITVSASYIETNISNPTDSKVWQAPYDSSVAGKISFSEVTSDRVKGTFNFKGKNVNGDGSIKNITEGAFNVKYTSQ